jgi:hypothetical protein
MVQTGDEFVLVPSARSLARAKGGDIIGIGNVVRGNHFD